MPNSRKRDLLYPYQDDVRILPEKTVTLTEKQTTDFQERKPTFFLGHVHTTPGEFEKATITGHFRSVLEALEFPSEEFWVVL